PFASRTSRSAARSTTPRSWRRVRPVRDTAYIALGSNLGDRAEHLARARAAIGALPSTAVLAESSIEETAPIGPIAQPAPQSDARRRDDARPDRAARRPSPDRDGRRPGA